MLHVGDIQCHACARRAEATLQRLHGVQAAKVDRRQGRARIRFDARHTSEQQIAAGLRRAGYQASTAPRSDSLRPAVELGLAVIAFGNLLAISRLSPRADDLSTGLMELALSALVLVLMGLPLLRRASADRLDSRDLLTSGAALAAFGVGIFELATVRPATLAVAGVFREVPRGTPLFGLQAAAGIMLLASLGRHAARVLQSAALAPLAAREARRDRALTGQARAAAADLPLAMDAEVCRALARIDASQARPRSFSFCAIAEKTVLVAAVSFAMLTLVLHSLRDSLEGSFNSLSGSLDGAPLHLSGLLPAIAVLVSASTTAFSIAAPVARKLSVLRARAAGVVIKDVRALEALDRVHIACLDATGEGASCLFPAYSVPWLSPSGKVAARALERHGMSLRVLSGDPLQEALAVEEWLDAPGSAGLSPSAKARVIRELQRRGQVLLVSAGAGVIPGAVEADVTVAIAPGTAPYAIDAPIVVSEGELGSLPALLDLAKALRRRLAENAALSVLYNALVLPAAALGWLPPLNAAFLLLLETLLVVGNSARLLLAPGAVVSRQPAELVKVEDEDARRAPPDVKPDSAPLPVSVRAVEASV